MDHYVTLPSGSKPEYNCLRGHTAPICALLVSNRLLISASDDKTIIIWDLNTLKKRGMLKGHTHRVRCLALFGTTLVSAGNDKKLRVWDVDSLAALKVVDAHSNWVRSVAIYEGTHCISASRDKTVKVWEMGSWALLGSFSASSDVYSVVAGNGMVYAACADFKIRVWNLRTMQKSHLLIGCVCAERLAGVRSVATPRVCEGMCAAVALCASRAHPHARVSLHSRHSAPTQLARSSGFSHQRPQARGRRPHALPVRRDAHALLRVRGQEGQGLGPQVGRVRHALRYAARPARRARARARAGVSSREWGAHTHPAGAPSRAVPNQATPNPSGASPTTPRQRSCILQATTRRSRAGRREKRNRTYGRGLSGQLRYSPSDEH